MNDCAHVLAEAEELVTETDEVSVYPPSSVVTVMVTLPVATPLTTPELLTVAILSSLLSQETSVLAASFGEIVAVKATVEPTSTDVDSGERLTLVTGTEPEVSF